MTLEALASDVGVDLGDVDVIARWLALDEVIDDAALEVELRGILDPDGQRTGRVASACPECGRLPGPYLVLRGWLPCRCGGHSTTYCTSDTGGCGHTRYEPELDPQRCSDAPFGFGQ